MRQLRAIGFGVLFSFFASLAHAETCLWLDRVDANFDNLDVMMAPTSIDVAGIACHCEGVCTAPLATWQMTDRVGNVIPLTGSLTCSTGNGLSTWVNVDTSGPNETLVAGEGLELSVTNTPVSFDQYTICIRFL